MANARTNLRLRFPPWHVYELEGGYAVEDAEGRRLGTFYGRNGTVEARTAGALTREEARATALDFARLVDLINAALDAPDDVHDSHVHDSHVQDSHVHDNDVHDSDAHDNVQAADGTDRRAEPRDVTGSPGGSGVLKPAAPQRGRREPRQGSTSASRGRGVRTTAK